MPAAAAAAATRLLERTAGQALDSDGAPVVAAAAALVAQADPASSRRLVAGLDDPGLALVAAAGAALVAPSAVDAFEVPARALTGPHRAHALSLAEPYLARADPDRTWRLSCDLLGEQAALHAGLGLDVASAAHRAGVPWQPQTPLPDAVARQLAADTAARDAVAGRLAGREAPALAPLHDDPTGSLLLPSEAPVLLVAAAAVDPAWGLDVAEALLRSHPPVRLAEALRLLAGAAAGAGLGDRLLALAQRDGFISEQATWALAAAAAGVLAGPALTALLGALVPRVEDELDPGHELVAGLPLVEAAAVGGELDHALALGLAWGVSPPLLVTRLQVLDDRTAAAALAADPGLDRLLDAPARSEPPLYDSAPSWWRATGADPSVRRDACLDALAVVVVAPWEPWPGSLADLVGWPPRSSAPATTVA